MPSKFFSSVPEPVATVDSHQATLQSLKANVEILTQQRKPKSSAAVTWQDLVDLGLIQASKIPT